MKNRKWLYCWLLTAALLMLSMAGCSDDTEKTLPVSDETEAMTSAVFETVGDDTEETSEIGEAASEEEDQEETSETEALVEETSASETAKAEETTAAPEKTTEAQTTEKAPETTNAPPEETTEAGLTVSEDGEYTDKESVALYIHLYGHLPSNYITKAEANDLGWESGDLYRYAEGKSIGGSKFGNYEGILPTKKGRQYYECDIDYHGGKRNAKRIVYSNDGLVYYTEDHYETFELLYE